MEQQIMDRSKTIRSARGLDGRSRCWLQMEPRGQKSGIVSGRLQSENYQGNRVCSQFLLVDIQRPTIRRIAYHTTNEVCVQSYCTESRHQFLNHPLSPSSPGVSYFSIHLFYWVGNMKSCNAPTRVLFTTS